MNILVFGIRLLINFDFESEKVGNYDCVSD